jgi:glycosyltransferase involved in cell wall biosynthesis
MRVALLAGRFGRGTGTGGFAWRLARSLQASGHTVGVWCGHADEQLEGVERHAMGPRWTAASRVPPGWVRLALDRVPHCELARASGGVHQAWRQIRDGLSLSLSSPREQWEAWLDKRTAQTARVVICNSLRTAGEVMAWHGVPAERIRVVPSGALDAVRPDPVLREQARAAWEIPVGGRVAMFLGHGFRRKGLQVAVLAFAQAAGPHDRLVVAGQDAHAERWLRPARELLREKLLAVGPLRPIERWLPGADALLLPTLYDSAANATLEAMAAGVPPVVSSKDGAAEQVFDRALVVGDPGDVEGFACALRYAWGTSGLGARCAVAATRWPETRMASAVEHLLMEFANG